MIRPVIQRLRIGAPPVSDEVQRLRARVAELTDTLNTLRDSNDRYRADNTQLRHQHGPILVGPDDAVRARKTLLDYEDQLAYCREHHGSNGRGSSLLREPTVAEVLAEKRWADR